MAALETLLVHLLSWLHKRIVLLHRLIRLLPASSSTFRQHSHPWAMATQCYNSVFPLVVVTAGDLCRPTPEPSSFTSFMAVLSMGFHEPYGSPVLWKVRDSNPRCLITTIKIYSTRTTSYCLAFDLSANLPVPSLVYRDLYLKTNATPTHQTKPTRFHTVNSPSFPTEKVKKQGATKTINANRHAAIHKPLTNFFAIIVSL